MIIVIQTLKTFVLMKTSFIFVFRRRLNQDKYICLSHSPSEDVFKTFWSRPIYSSWPYVFKTSCQDVFKTSCKNVFKTTSRSLQNVFKTSWKDAFKRFWKRIIRSNVLPSSRICLGHTSEKFMVSVGNLQVW